MRTAVFFDRDGTLNQDVGHNADLARLRVFPEAPLAVKLVREAGFQVVLASNQSGIARGLFEEPEVEAINREVARVVGGFDAIFYCPHHPRQGRDGYRRDCTCRKPAPGMLFLARDLLGLDLSGSLFIGDRATDLGAARAAGCGAAIRVATGPPPEGVDEPPAADGEAWDHVANDVLEAARWAVMWRRR